MSTPSSATSAEAVAALGGLGDRASHPRVSLACSTRVTAPRQQQTSQRSAAVPRPIRRRLPGGLVLCTRR
jgi:hypothetical protein